MTTQSKLEAQASSEELEEFLEGVCASDPFKVEKEFGHGYVKLRSTEAEKRQAAQDIKCVEDIVIELLRNSRDAGARNIFIATAKDGSKRTLTVIDDGAGIPHELWETVFEPRVTSKLETAHMDKWGMHGRGMALYSTKVNTSIARVVASEPELGCSIHIEATDALPEKADQSTFPHFEEVNGVMAMRGPKNILRTCCEFALEHRHEVSVHVGTPAQIISTLYRYGLSTIPAFVRAFPDDEPIVLTKLLGLAHGPDDLMERAARLGLAISLRTARRIIDGESEGLDDLATLMAKGSFKASTKAHRGGCSNAARRSPAVLSRMQAGEKAAFLEQVMAAYGDLADAYYLKRDVAPVMRMHDGKLILEIPLASLDDGDDAEERSVL